MTTVRKTQRDATTAEPYVSSYEPGPWAHRLYRVGNALLVPVLRSRLGARIRDLALLTFAGRRTGKRYAVPIALYEVDGARVITTAARWRANLRGGADVLLLHRGTTSPMRATLIEDPDQVADTYARLLAAVGVQRSRRVGLRVAGERMPSHAELVAAVGGRRAAITLTSRVRGTPPDSPSAVGAAPGEKAETTRRAD
jgi:hypothetical protein